MGDLVLVQAPQTYDRSTYARMIDILENTFNNISTVFAQVKKSAYQLFASTTPVGNIGGGEDTLITYTMQPNILGKDGYNVEIKAWGTFGATANNKEVKLYFGGTVIYSTGTHAVNDGTWLIDATVVRSGPSTEQSIASAISSNTAVANSVTYTVVTESLSANVIIKCTGDGVVDDDIIQQGMIIRVFPKE